MAEQLYRIYKRGEILERAREIADAGPNITYPSRVSSEYVRKAIRDLLFLIVQPESRETDNMRNRVALEGHTGAVRIGDLEPGQMFQALDPQNSDNVYMRIRGYGAHAHYAQCVLLTTGEVYQYDGDKRITPL